CAVPRDDRGSPWWAFARYPCPYPWRIRSGVRRRPLQASGATFGVSTLGASTIGTGAAVFSATGVSAASSFSTGGGLKMRLASDPSGACRGGRICWRGLLALALPLSRELISDSICERNSLEARRNSLRRRATWRPISARWDSRWRLSPCKTGITLFERVADGKAEARGIRRTEQLVVGDEIDLGLWPDEEIVRGIELEARAEVSHEVFIGRVVGVAIAAILAIDTCIDRADAGNQLQVGMAGEFGCVNPVE